MSTGLPVHDRICIPKESKSECQVLSIYAVAMGTEVKGYVVKGQMYIFLARLIVLFQGETLY